MPDGHRFEVAEAELLSEHFQLSRPERSQKPVQRCQLCSSHGHAIRRRVTGLFRFSRSEVYALSVVGEAEPLGGDVGYRTAFPFFTQASGSDQAPPEM